MGWSAGWCSNHAEPVVGDMGWWYGCWHDATMHSGPFAVPTWRASSPTKANWDLKFSIFCWLQKVVQQMLQSVNPPPKTFNKPVYLLTCFWKIYRSQGCVENWKTFEIVKKKKHFFFFFWCGVFDKSSAHRVMPTSGLLLFNIHFVEVIMQKPGGFSEFTWMMVHFQMTFYS